MLIERNDLESYADGCGHDSEVSAAQDVDSEERPRWRRTILFSFALGTGMERASDTTAIISNSPSGECSLNRGVSRSIRDRGVFKHSLNNYVKRRMW